MGDGAIITGGITMIKRIAGILAFAVLTTGVAFAQQDTGTSPSQGMMQKCQQMMAAKQQMMTDLKQSDQELTNLAQQMKSSQGEQKIQAIEQILSKMVEQRTSMHARMMDQQHGMMKHMGEHAGSGGPMGMMNCPMMQGSGAAAGGAASATGDHSAHH
jgi:maltooligosyltrehalose synthase